MAHPTNENKRDPYKRWYKGALRSPEEIRSLQSKMRSRKFLQKRLEKRAILLENSKDVVASAWLVRCTLKNFFKTLEEHGHTLEGDAEVFIEHALIPWIIFKEETEP